MKFTSILSFVVLLTAGANAMPTANDALKARSAILEREAAPESDIYHATYKKREAAPESDIYHATYKKRESDLYHGTKKRRDAALVV
ncbi:hypothetical protein D6C79_00728 [Aureobasidium pullulans]|nr:hypothetical protein D6C79_00728 [Aureobasidium pullulans]